MGQAPVFRSGVNLVLVDLTVSGDEKLASSLHAEDVELLIDGQPRPIASLTFVGRGIGESPGSPSSSTGSSGRADASAAANAVERSFAFVIDSNSIRAGEERSALAASARFIERLATSDRVGVVSLPAERVTMTTGPDRAAAVSALMKTTGTFQRIPTPHEIADWEAIDIAHGDREVLDRVSDRVCPESPEARRRCRERLPDEAHILAAEAEHRSTETLRALRRIIESLGGLPGVKHLVLVTGGVSATMGDLLSVGQIARAAAASRVTVHVLQVAAIPAFGAAEERQSQTPGWISLAPAAAQLASATGGIALAPVSGGVFFARLERDLGVAYLLAFEPRAVEHDGKPHRIELRYRGRGKLQLKHRRELIAPPRPPQPPATPSAKAPSSADRPVASTLPAADLRAVLARGAEYVTRFEQTLSSVVLEERYVQVVKPWTGTPREPSDEPELIWRDSGSTRPVPRPNGPRARRQLLSDFLLVQTPGETWVGYRDVAEVDGKPVRDRADRVQRLFLSKTAEARAQLGRIARESARLNLGAYRTVNTPTYILQVLHPRWQPHFAFSASSKDVDADGCCVVLSYAETANPTMIATRSGHDIPMKGSIWIEPATGRVRRTLMELPETRWNPRSVLDVTYEPLAGVDMLVPVRMWEWYYSSEVRSPMGTIVPVSVLVEGLATYTNLRRFTVTTTEAPSGAVPHR
jgi:VWFA-related protein